MAHPGDDRRTRSQTAQSFITPRGHFEGESGDVPTSTPSGSMQMMVEFFRAKERRAQREEERRAQREEERVEREAQQWEEERRFGAEQQQCWIGTLQNAKLPPPVAAPPQLSVQKFNKETDEMEAYLDTFEAVATASDWPRTQWSIHL